MKQVLRRLDKLTGISCCYMKQVSQSRWRSIAGFLGSPPPGSQVRNVVSSGPVPVSQSWGTKVGLKLRDDSWTTTTTSKVCRLPSPCTPPWQPGGWGQTGEQWFKLQGERSPRTRPSTFWQAETWKRNLAIGRNMAALIPLTAKVPLNQGQPHSAPGTLFLSPSISLITPTVEPFMKLWPSQIIAPR